MVTAAGVQHRHESRIMVVRQGKGTPVNGIVTPEAVQLDFADAGIGSRGAALIIDVAIVFTTLIIVSIGASAAFGLSPVPGWVAVSTLLILNFLILFGYPVVCEVAFGGRSVGKMALGLRVVTREGAPVGFRHAAIRSAFMLVDFIVTGGAGAVLSAALTARSQRLGDLVAGTVVLRQRHAAGEAKVTRFAVPAGAEGYASTISPTVLNSSQYERIRAFLLRSDELADGARTEIATSLARPLLGVTPAPPAGMDAVTYLRVVAGVYQRGHTASPAATGQPSFGSGTAPPVPSSVTRPGPSDDRGFAAPE